MGAEEKVKGFDLHPDVPMVERHTFNLRENEVETVGKKERFRRNIMAIQLLKNVRKKTDLPLLKNRLSYQSMLVGVDFQKPLMKIIQRGQLNIWNFLRY